MSEKLLDKAPADGREKVQTLARMIATEAPQLEDLTEEQLQHLAQVVVAETLKEDLRRRADQERIDYPAERERFLKRSSRTGSQHTQDLCRRALGRLDAWCAVQAINPLALIPARADDWIAELRGQGRAPATVNVDVSAASAFWTWLERRHTDLHNPFRGTRARPLSKPARKLVVPSEKEVETLAAEASGWLRAAIVVMATAGLRVGALPSLSITGTRWTALTKGKEQSGTIPEVARVAMGEAGLPLRGPFAGYKVVKVKDAFRYLVARLQREGKLRGSYSAHDLRHAYAVRLYRQGKDIYTVKQALGHASVAVTERYLRSMGLTG